MIMANITLEKLLDKMDPAIVASADKKAKAILAAMPLQELRRARQLSQEQMAQQLHIKQSSISKLEHRADIYISTLRNFVRAMGGELEIKAVFPDSTISIDQFHLIGQETEPKTI
jgi:DNA-binding XRE family transcriptional regulator